MSLSLAWRQRRTAMSKKFALEAELLMEAEVLDPVGNRKQKNSTESSPVTIASTFDEFLPEMKSFMLPGAWTVVGKGGRPLKNLKTYDSPKKPKKKKKKSAMANSHDTEDPLGSLIDMPSSSKCLNDFERATAKYEKTTTRGRDARYWARYRQAKQEKSFLLDALTATLGDDGMLGDEIETAMIETPRSKSMPKSMMQRANGHAQRVRRKARQASQAAKCCSPDDMLELEEAKLRMFQYEKMAHEEKPHGKGKETQRRKVKDDETAAPGLGRWLPQMKQLRSMVQAVLESDGGGELVEDCAELKKRKEERSPNGKKGKKSKLWREGKAAAAGRKSCIMM